MQKQITPDEFAELIAEHLIKKLIAVGAITPDSIKGEDVWGTRQEAADIVKCSLPTIHRMMNQGYIVFKKCGRKTVINLTDLRHKLDDGTLAKYRHK